MDSRLRDFIYEKELHLYMQDDTEKLLLDAHPKTEIFKEHTKKRISHVLSSYILQRLDRYSEVFNTVNDYKPSDVFEVERTEINMYIFSEAELEEFLKIRR